MKVILASSSPRRKELMDLAKIEYEVLASHFDENVDKTLNLEEQSKELAFGKAKDVFENTQGNRAIIGSDTLVILDGKQLGKPQDRNDAINMLKSLQGKSHIVYTSLAVLIEKNGEYKEYKELYKTEVFVNEMSDEEIENYVDIENPLDKAGAYAIQSCFSVYIRRIVGDYASIVGLPINRVYRILKENDII